jgi:hypothetical protein
MSSNVPFQVQHLIDSMLSPKDNVFVRGNFRTRLVTIRDEIDKAIKDYDKESFSADQQLRRKGK